MTPVGSTPSKFWWGCAACRWKFQNKICDFPYPISELTQNFKPYFRAEPYPISNDKSHLSKEKIIIKITSSKNSKQFHNRVHLLSLFQTKTVKIYILFQTKTAPAKSITLWGRLKRVPPLPSGGDTNANVPSLAPRVLSCGCKFWYQRSKSGLLHGQYVYIPNKTMHSQRFLVEPNHEKRT